MKTEPTNPNLKTYPNRKVHKDRREKHLRPTTITHRKSTETSAVREQENNNKKKDGNSKRLYLLHSKF